MGLIDSIFHGLGFGFGSGIGHKVAEEAIDAVGDMLDGKNDASPKFPLSPTPPPRPNIPSVPVPPGYSTATATSVRFCGQCGTPNERSDKFCSECGAALKQD